MRLFDRHFADRAAPHRVRRLISLLACVILAACATSGEQKTLVGRHIPPEHACTEAVFDHPPAGFDIADHIVAADSFGGYDPDVGQTGITVAPTLTEQIKKILAAHARFRASEPARPDRILLFINGGLTGLGYTADRAREQVPCMLRDGYFPIFLAWRTGGVDTYWEQVSRIRGGRQYRSIRWDTPVYVVSDVGEAIARAPATYLTQFRRYLDSVIDYSQSTLEAKGVVESHVLNLQYEGPEDTPGSLFTGALKYAVTSPFKVATVPFATSFGRTAYENMVRRAEVTIHQSAEFQPREPDRREILSSPRGTGVFSQFMAELRHCVLHDASCLADDRGASLRGLKITLISHSLGTQIAEHLVSIYDDLPYRNVVHMGAASSIRHFLDTLEPIIENRPQIRFYNLSLHPSADARQVSVYGLIPSGSVLEWIDDMYADPPTPLDRTMGKWLNDAAAEYVFAPELHDRMVFRVFGFRSADPDSGDPGDPTLHTDFAETRMHYWLPDFWSLQRPGDSE